MTDIKEIPLMHFGISPLFSPEGDKKKQNYEKSTLTSLTHGILALRQKMSSEPDHVKNAYGNIKQMVESEFSMEDLEQQRADGKAIPDNKLQDNRVAFFKAITTLAQNLNLKKDGPPLNRLFFDLVGHSNTYRWESKDPKAIAEANNDLTRLVDALTENYNSFLPKSNTRDRIHIPMEYVRDSVLNSKEMQLFRSTLRELRVEARAYGLAKKVFTKVEKDFPLESNLKNFFFAYSSLEALILNGDKRLSEGLPHKSK